MSDKKKILLISDHPLVPSGVGTQAKYICEGLLETGKYSFVCFGGAVQHASYKTQKVSPEKYGDDWIIFPVNGYGDKEKLRKILVQEKPDAVLMFTDPRFFVWIWEMEDEVRSVCPLIYWHVWDNDPSPRFNNIFYNSTDYIVSLSLKTKGLLQDLKYENTSYIPHSVSEQTFKPLPTSEIDDFKVKFLGPHADKKFIVFWNNRNARRKQTGDVIASFSMFAEQVGKKNVALMMHTAPNDPEGQDIIAVAKRYNIDRELIISEQRISPEQLNMFYNIADCTINIASNEGFGLSTLESLSSGTPIIVHMTGGLQFQIGNWWEERKDFSDQNEMTAFAKSAQGSRKYKWWGRPVFPASRSCTGSQQIPYIYDDRVCHEDCVNALVSLYDIGRNSRKELGLEAREWVLKNFNSKKMIEDWDIVLQEQIDKHKKKLGPSIRLATV